MSPIKIILLIFLIIFALGLQFQFSTSHKVGNWILHTFQHCTIQMLGNPVDFNEEITIFAQRIPLVLDRFEFDQYLGRYNTTKLRKSTDKFPSVFSRHLSRFKGCTTTLFYPFIHPKKTSQIEEMAVVISVKEFIRGMVFSNENPNFIIFMFKNADLAYGTCNTVTKTIRSEAVTSIGLLAVPLREEVKLFCFTCANSLDNPLGNLVSLSTRFGIHLLQKEVEVLNKDLRGNLIFVVRTMINPAVWKAQTCSLLRSHEFYTPSVPCSLYKLSQMLNFTPFSAPRENLFSELYIGPPMTVGLVDDFLRSTKKSGMKMVWISYGTMYKSYEYVAFMKTKDAVDLLRVFQPFSVATLVWSAVAFAFALMALRMVTPRNRKRWAMFYFIKTFLGQGDSEIVSLCQKYVPGGYFILTVWLVFSNVVGNEYQGHVTSAMTSVPIQKVPTTVRDLVMNSDLPYYTTTGHTHHDRWRSTLKDVVLQEIIPVEKNNRTKSFLQKLKARIALIMGDSGKVAYNLSKNFPILTDLGWTKISNNFAIISTNTDMGALLSATKLLTTYLILAGKMEINFKTKVPWLGKRNFFLNLAQKRLAWLEQSGIYDNWYIQFERHIQIQNLKFAQTLYNFTKRYNYYKMTEYTKVDRTNIEFGGMVTMKEVNMAVIALGILVGTSVLVFFLEHVIENTVCPRRQVIFTKTIPSV